MREEVIEQAIDGINEGSWDGRIFMRPLMENISIARVWLGMPKGEGTWEEGDRFYFIFEESGQKCVGAVLDMGANDLHVFMKSEYRRRGIMSRALKRVVLPHLFEDGRQEQRATYDSPASRGLLAGVGFTLVDSSHAVMKPENCPKVEFPVQIRVELSEAEMKSLKKRIRMAAGLLRMAEEQIAFTTAEEVCEELDFLRSDVFSVADRLEDVWWKKKSP